MSKTVTADQFAHEMQSMLDEYAKQSQEVADKAVETVAKDTAKKLKKAGRSNWNKYPKGWTTQIEQHRLYTEATVYNRKYPGLTHLLEFGHALKRGGRTIGKGFVEGIEHIAPINNEVESELIKELEKGMSE